MNQNNNQNPEQNPAARFFGDPASIVALAPALLKIHPDRSTVVIALDRGGRVLVSMRTDIPNTPTDQSQVAATYVANLLKVRAAAALVLTFHPDRLAAYSSRAEIVEALRSAGITVARELHVTDTRVIDADGHEHPLPTDEQIEQTRQIIGAPAPVDRNEKIQRVAPIEDAAVHAQTAALELAEADPTDAALALEAMCCLYLATGQIAARDVARYLLDITAGDYRDAVTLAIAAEQAMPNLPDVLVYTARRAPRAYAGHAYALAGLALYLTGEEVSARAALEHALAADRSNPLAGLLHRAIEAMIAPSTIRDLITTSL